MRCTDDQLGWNVDMNDLLDGLKRLGGLHARLLEGQPALDALERVVCLGLRAPEAEHR